MSNRSINLRPKLDRLDDIPTTVTAEKRDRRSFTETDTSVEILNIPSRKTQSFGAGNIRKPSPRISVSVIHENKVFEVQRSGTMESGGFERHATAQHSANHNPYRKTSRMGVPLSTGAVNPGFSTSRGSSIYGGSLGSLPIIREQYCCWARWTRRERILFAIIGILGFFVLCLLIAVGSLLGITKDEKPICLPMLFFGRCAES